MEASSAATRGFKAVISRSMASRAAAVEARYAAMRSAARSFGQLNEVQLFLGAAVMRAAPRPEPLALAWAMLQDEEAESSVSGVPPDMQVHITLRVRLDESSAGLERLPRLLARPEYLDLYARSARMQAAALKEYDAAALYFLRPGAQSRADKKETALAARKLEAAYAALEAAEAHTRLLPLLYPQDSALPADSEGALLELVEGLWRANPNYLLAAELARLRLMHGHAQSAKNLLDKSLATKRDFAQGYDLRGQCLLWLELPSLALADFDRAIRLEPYHPGFYENRALARRVLEDIPAMCEDLAESCRLGECVGLDWGASEGLCKK